jgi:hypothetical protein
LNWILLVACCAAFVLFDILGRRAAYERGLQLGISGTFSAMPGSLVVVMAVLSGFVFALLLLGQIFLRRTLSKGFLLVLILIPITWASPRRLEIPSYMEGISLRLHDSPFLPRFVETAAAEVAKTKPDDRGSSYHVDRERGEELFFKGPFQSAGFKFPPRASILSRSLILDWGGSMSFRWGMTISGEKGASPELPRDALKYSQLSPEIILYTVPPA